MSVTIDQIEREALASHQKHRQLTMREAETIGLVLVELLCDDSCSDEATLKYLARLLTPQLYRDIVDERNLNRRCGYLLCSDPPERIRDPFAMDTVTRKFMWENNPYVYLSQYCSKYHFRCSQFYEVQLSDDPLFTRTGVHLVRDPLRDEQDKYTVRLFEELVRERATAEDIKALVTGVSRLQLKNGDGASGRPSSDSISTSSISVSDELSNWLAEVKIVEHSEPHILGDLADTG